MKCRYKQDGQVCNKELTFVRPQNSRVVRALHIGEQIKFNEVVVTDLVAPSTERRARVRLEKNHPKLKENQNETNS